MTLREFHDRLSIHPQNVERCRSALMGMAQSSGIEGAEEEIEGLSDWEVVQKVENLRRGLLTTTRTLQGFNCGLKAAAARFSALGEALIPLMAEGAAQELELFLAIDHSD